MKKKETKLTTLYHVFSEDFNCEGMFTEKGELLDWWFDNDATWRNEYFSGFMEKLGFEVKHPKEGSMKVLMEAALEEQAQGY